MNEVSCKVFGVFVGPLKRKGLTLDAVAEGTRVPAAKLHDKKQRIDWADFCAIMRNLRPHFTDDEYVELGREYLRSPGLRFAFVIARVLFTPMDFFRWFNKPRDGVGNQMFNCVAPSQREVSENEIEVDLTLPEGFEVCADFNVITIGNYSELPRLLGLPSAKVRLTPIPRGGRFHITVPQKKPLLSRLWRAITWPFTARAAARELKEAHETLLERYEELEQARARLAEYQLGLEKLVNDRTAELSHARDELAGTVEQLREAQGARERFFGNISHEIRTPLSLILLSVGDVEARANAALDDRARRGLGSIAEAARKLLRLVDELLLLAAGEESKLALHFEPTDLVALAQGLVSAWLPAADANGLELVGRTSTALTARVDPVAIERVATNLISNAVKYTPRGGRVEVELAHDSDGIRLSVLDNGPGIAPELAARLFGRFERGTGDARKKTGAGIGLALVKQLVEAHGGTVAAVARPQGGTEMRVLLPSSRLASAGAKHVYQLPVGSSVSTLRSGAVFSPQGVSAGTIVLAEDDAPLAETTAMLLSDEYTVYVALDGADAIPLVSKYQPQMLITDVEMPTMNGVELARRFREMTGDKLAPVIIVSAVIDLGTRVAGLEAGAIDYVTKPFDPAELKARVKAQFRMRELANRLHRAEQLSTLGILTSGLAHELRNPANGIVNAIGPLRELLPEEVRQAGTATGELLDVVASCAEQVSFLARQLLGFREGRLDLRHAQIADLVQRACVLSSKALDGVKLRTDLKLEDPLMCAPPLLVQVLANLIENAAHAAGNGGWVEIDGRAEGGRITVEVADSGPGVPRELRERVFEPFFTTKAPGVGTGLGLPLARTIVHRHGGVLEIRERGTRSVFVMELPHQPSV